jgi:uncharacterized protein (TIGR04255 family)
MSAPFPIPFPERLPTRISPCPIIEAILEVRFVTGEDWSVLPGLLYTRIRDRYGEKKLLPLSQLPEELRRSDPALIHQPLVQFLRPGFVVQFGPRVLALAAVGEYPGWSAIRNEMEWLLARVQEAGFLLEGERLGMRYIDFFPGDVFPNLVIRTMVGETPLDGSEMALTKVLRHPPFTARLVLNNSSMVTVGDEARRGSILDLDLWVGPSHFDVFTNGIERFSEAHELNKQVFFGLLRPEFLATFSPEYR